MMVVLILPVFSLFFLLYVRWRLGEGLLSILNIAFVFAMFDVFVPAVVFAITGRFPEHLRSPDKINTALIFYSMYLTLFTLGYWGAQKYVLGNWPKKEQVEVGRVFNKRAAHLVLIVLFLVYAAFLLKEINKFGFGGWLNMKGSRASYGLFPDYISIFDQLTTQLSMPALSAFFVIIATYLAKNEGKYPCLFWGLLILGFLLSETTFSRASASILLLALSVAVAFKLTGRKKVLGIVLIMFAAVANFFTIGMLRTQIELNIMQQSSATMQQSSATMQQPSATTNELRRIVRGEGLVGLANILGFYENRQKFEGKTYKDSLLLPVPRLIYKDKPRWYGAADITRPIDGKMGQDAVTIAGESYANFGWFGLGVCLIWGVLLRILARITEVWGYEMLLPAGLIPAFICASWMGSIGMVNNLVAFFLALVCLSIIYRKTTRY